MIQNVQLRCVGGRVKYISRREALQLIKEKRVKPVLGENAVEAIVEKVAMIWRPKPSDGCTVMQAELGDRP